MDFEYVPFGNARYSPRACARASNKIACFNETCGPQALERPGDCFEGRPTCQHGEQECATDRYLACAKQELPDSHAFLEFMQCMIREDGQLPRCLSDPARARAVQSCFDGAAGDEAVRRAARATPAHDSTPWVLVDGVRLEDVGSRDGLLRAVCDAYEGPAKPAACAAAQA